MKGTAGEIYETYLAELVRYRLWMDETAAKYGGSHSPMRDWDNHDYEKAKTRSAQLNFGERLLGLTAEEIQDADHKAGIQHFLSDSECEHLAKCCREVKQ